MAIPVLMYHNVAEVPDGLHPDGRCLYVTPAAFAAQMALLRRFGWRGVSMSEAMPYLRGERRGRIAAITFDDGYLDNLENAMPILQRHGFSATCYIVNGCIAKHNLWDAAKLGVHKPMMNVEQLHAWRVGGMEIGAHTRTHPHLTQCSDAQLQDEIAGGRRELEDLLGIAVPQFCYPFGDADARVARVARDAGFVASPTVRRGRAGRGMDLFMLPRVAIDNADGLMHFAIRTFTPFEDWRARKAA
ncbi:MAG: Polysaccharide deacetylase [Rhodanobacteraceae bacterium]|jgi:peptidoglycan/xylan/chitin deacetylase (PgdA/CDA1 family)|nr:MAG: Polysaccharide deacetylase [Rhodanobacteraceae bacterium]